MKRFDLCILNNNILDYKKGTFAIILDMDEGDYYNLELWNFEHFDGAKLSYLDKKYLRPCTDIELKEYQFKFKEYCDKNESSLNQNNEKGNKLLDEKLKAFIEDLKNKGYSSYEYFEKIRLSILNNEKDAKEHLRTSFAITQYSNFSRDLEEKLKEIIALNQ
ncbi:hypothetical protein [Pseudotamlana carrageenivorans]|uniref:Uncharacterized protein n=1 Tax=Pseudotamlana carrageenivorans TaxID=2069432 RepID=A0A2I7SJQ9_9FLAO|nr:hypothetical protein [Tamlana carrageenivorans]AUS06131.1 hypothetical protein C1A40_12010 [Tamlana carrageenivorans]